VEGPNQTTIIAYIIACAIPGIIAGAYYLFDNYF